MRNFLLGLLLAVIAFLVYDRWTASNELLDATATLDRSLENVQKLVTVEAQYAKVYRYDSKKKELWGFYDDERELLISATATADVRFDLRKLQYELDADTKTLKILSLPRPETRFSPKFQYYDVQKGFFSTLQASDYNRINKKVAAQFKRDSDLDQLERQGRERLFLELNELFVLTRSLEWTLVLPDGAKVEAGRLLLQ